MPAEDLLQNLSTNLNKLRETRRNLWLTGFFSLLFIIQLAHHQLWRDELNAWGLAQASPTLATLFHHLHYEAHPWVWYLLLWMVTHLMSSALALKVIAACVAISAYVILGLRSPFSFFEKLLLFSSYFISFEYTVLSRMYGILLLIVILYLWRRGSHPDQVLWNSFLLGLLPSTDTIGLILSAGLVVEYAVSYLFHRKNSRQIAWQSGFLGVLLYTMMTAFAVWCARPASDISWRTTGHPFDHWDQGAHLVITILSVVVLPFFSVGFGPLAASFWNPVAGQNLPIYLLALPLILWAYYRIFHRSISLLLLIAIVFLLSILFAHLIFLGAMRHWGVTFLAFVSALWLLRRNGRSLPLPALVLLTLSALSGIYTACAQWQRPFSNAETTAAWLRVHHLEEAPIAGTPDTTVASLAVLLHRPIYMLDCDCSDTYVLFSNRRDAFNRSQIPDRLVTASRRLATAGFLYIDASPLTQANIVKLSEHGIAVRPLTAFTGATFSGEDFYVYEVSILRLRMEARDGIEPTRRYGE